MSDQTLIGPPPTPPATRLSLLSSPLHVLWIYPLLFAAFYTVAYTFGLYLARPTDQSMHTWDVNWYWSVAREGYQYSETQQTNSPFFPMLPWVWRLTGLSTLGMGLLNAAIALTGLGLLARTLRLTLPQTLLLASVPSAFIWSIPYAEAIFYWFGALLLIGLHRDRLPLILLGLFGCCLTRSAATLLIPAFGFTILLDFAGTRSFRRTAGYLLSGLLVMALAIGLIMWIQARDTGEPLAFFKGIAHWKHVLRFPPRLPFYTDPGTPLFWLDALALFVQIGSALTVLTLLGRWLINLVRGTAWDRPPLTLRFALGYFFGTAFYVMAYQESNMVGANRYVFATPYFAVLMTYAWHWTRTSPRWRHWVAGGGLLGLVAGAVLFGFPYKFDNFLPGEVIVYLGLMALYALLWIVSQQEPLRREITTGLCLFNLVMQGFLLNLFLQSIWVG